MYGKMQRGTEETNAQMVKEKIIGDVLREDAAKRLTQREESQDPAVEYDELGRPMNVWRRFAKWLKRVVKHY